MKTKKDFIDKDVYPSQKPCPIMEKVEKKETYLVTYIVSHKFKEIIEASSEKEAQKRFCALIGLSQKFKEKVGIKKLS